MLASYLIFKVVCGKTGGVDAVLKTMVQSIFLYWTNHLVIKSISWFVRKSQQDERKVGRILVSGPVPGPIGAALNNSGMSDMVETIYASTTVYGTFI